jgi:hypothetical protein
LGGRRWIREPCWQRTFSFATETQVLSFDLCVAPGRIGRCTPTYSSRFHHFLPDILAGGIQAITPGLVSPSSNQDPTCSVLYPTGYSPKVSPAAGLLVRFAENLCWVPFPARALRCSHRDGSPTAQGFPKVSLARHGARCTLRSDRMSELTQLQSPEHRSERI